MKKIFYTELSYLLGIVTIALGTAFMEAADFGVSMIVAPAYLFYKKLSETFAFFTFGMAEYLLQGGLLLIMILLLRRFRLSYLFSFVTAVIYGVVLDGLMLLVGLLPTEVLACRIVLYLAGMLICAFGVAMMFRTYLSPEVYELLVKEVAGKYNIPVSRFKTIYDCASCALSVVLSFLFFGFGHFEGVKWGTIVCALINGTIIGWISAGLDKVFTFRDKLNLRRFFE